MKLLIVDDEIQIREGLKEATDWKSMGFEEVFIAENGIEALDIYRAVQPEIVITDIRMPGMDGLELSRKIREYSALTKIVILSGYFELDYAKKALHAGVNDYELKPIRIKNLIRLLLDLKDKYDEETAEKKEDPLLGVPVRSGGMNPSIAKAVDYMKKNFSKELSIETMAAHLGITPNYYSHLFKKETGIPFSEYLNKIRIHEAKELLRQTSLMAYQIMERVGFHNYKYFIQVFKRLEGVSPSDYRKM